MDINNGNIGKIYIIPDDAEKMCFAVKEIISDISCCCGGLSEEKIFEFKVILNELMVNAFMHGNKMDKRKGLRIEMRKTCDNRLCLSIRDEGDGFDYAGMYDKTRRAEVKATDGTTGQECPEEARYLEEGGRGLMIVRNLCDCVSYNRKGNRVVIIKRIY